MRSRTVPLAVGLAVPVSFVIAAVIATVRPWNAGPNYTVAPTASCLREHGYAVTRIPESESYSRYPGITASRGRFQLDAYFTPNTGVADQLATRIYSNIERHNVVFDSMVVLPEDGPVVDCLRTS